MFWDLAPFKGSAAPGDEVSPLLERELPTIGMPAKPYMKKVQHKSKGYHSLYRGFEFGFGKREGKGFASVSAVNLAKIDQPGYRMIQRMEELLATEEELHIVAFEMGWHDLSAEELLRLSEKTLPPDAKLVNEGRYATYEDKYVYLYRSESMKSQIGYEFIEIHLEEDPSWPSAHVNIYVGTVEEHAANRYHSLAYILN